MNRIAVSCLIAGMLCSSMLAVAEGPIPFSSLAKNPGADPVAIPLRNDRNPPNPAVVPSTHSDHMTTGGKVLTGVGIGLVAVGTIVFVSGATMVNDSWFGDAAAPAMGAGAVIGGGGVALIVFGSHRRSTK